MIDLCVVVVVDFLLLHADDQWKRTSTNAQVPLVDINDSSSLSLSRFSSPSPVHL